MMQMQLAKQVLSLLVVCAFILLACFGFVFFAFTSPQSDGSILYIEQRALGSAPGRFNSIRVADIDGDGRREIVFGNYEGVLQVLEFHKNNITTEWRSESLGSRLWGIYLGDIDCDGTMEIIAGTGDDRATSTTGEAYVYIFDGKTRNLEWRSENLGSDAHGLAVGDIDGDGTNELVVGTGFRKVGGYLYIFDGRTHQLEWRSERFDSRLRAIVLADIDSDNTTEIIVGSGNAIGETEGEGYIYVFNGKTHELEWQSENMHGDVMAMCVEDIDRDGRLEIVISVGYRERDGYVAVLGAITYQEKWRYTGLGPKPYGLAVGDCDSDGKKEIIIGTKTGYLHVLDAETHTEKWRSDYLGMDLFGIALADLNSDGTTEILAISGGYAGIGDWTSNFSPSQLYIFNGKNYGIEWQFRHEYISNWVRTALIFLLLVVILRLNIYVKQKQCVFN